MFANANQLRALSLSTIAFTVCFAVWTIFSIIGVEIKEELGLSESQFGLLVATPVLTGSISRLFLGIWTELYGGRLVYTLQMLVTAICTWLLASVTSYPMFLLAALGVGLAGGSFIVGIAYTSKWFEKEKQGTALGIFGAGNVGAAVTNFAAPFLLVAYGWEMTAQIYAVIMLAMAVIFWLVTSEDPVTVERKKSGAAAMSIADQLRPLRKLQVWRFSLYYFFTFGGFVALASWLPRYYSGVYDLDIQTAGMLAAAYSLPAAGFRALGGVLADKYGARRMMYITFLVCMACTFVLSYPPTSYVVEGINGPIKFSLETPLTVFVIIMIIFGMFMSFGMAATYKHIPVYYPDHVGSVGGLVGMLGGLGGFFLPVAFGVLNDLLHVWTSCFMLMFGLVTVTLIWMHLTIRRMEERKYPQLRETRNQLELSNNDTDQNSEKGIDA